MTSFNRDFWNRRYEADTYVFGTSPAAFLTEQAKVLAPGSRIFVPADGEGRNSVFLAGLGHNVVATDVAEAGVAKARRLAATAGVEVDFRCLDLATFDWPDATYDAVVAIFIQFAPPAFRDELFAGMKRLVRPGGVLLLHGYTPEQLAFGTGGPPIAEHLYTGDLLREAFGDWSIERLETYERELDEGKGHKGRSALVDLVARRPV